MWITNYMLNKDKNKLPKHGSVSQTEENKVSVSSSHEQRNLPIIAPYGVAFCPPIGAETAVLPLDNSYAVLGVYSDSLASQPKLLPGEIRLFSLGGAYIHLKNNGKVIINGKEF